MLRILAATGRMLDSRGAMRNLMSDCLPYSKVLEYSSALRCGTHTVLDAISSLHGDPDVGGTG